MGNFSGLEKFSQILTPVNAKFCATSLSQLFFKKNHFTFKIVGQEKTFEVFLVFFLGNLDQHV